MIRKIVSSIWVVPSAMIAVAITTAGLLEAGEYFNTYFPQVAAWIDVNAIVILMPILVILTFAIVALAWYNNQLLKKQDLTNYSNQINKIILFISPSGGGGGDFYQEHFSHLVRCAAISANSQLSIIITLMAPPRNFANFDPELLMDMVKNYPGPVSGVFMIPAHPDKEENKKGLIQFKEKFPSLVLLDVYLGSTERLSKSINFIGGNENEGGKLAASLAKRWLFKCAQKDTYRILILKGRSTKWELQRVESFKTSLEEFFGSEKPSLKISFEETKDLHYELEKARKEIQTRINGGEKLENFDLIYACNDEMAIGALEAIVDIVSRKQVDPQNLPKIIGYDGIPEMKRLIKMGNQFLLGTVDVDIEEQAEMAIRIMIMLLNNQKPQSEIELLHPTLIVNSDLL